VRGDRALSALTCWLLLRLVAIGLLPGRVACLRRLPGHFASLVDLQKGLTQLFY